MSPSILLRSLLFLPFICWSEGAAEPAHAPPQVVFMISEPEYDTKTTVPAFAKAELEPGGVHCTYSIAPADHPGDFPGLDAALPAADLLFISVRRQAPTEAQMKLIRAHVAAGKPVVGIRTASHAFAPPLEKNAPPAPAGHAYWPEFDHEVLGGNYQNHYGVGISTLVKIVPEMAGHPVLAGIGPEEFRLTSHLYKNPDLPATVTKLMTGRMDGRPEVEPVAWVNTANDRRVFYTSLGSQEDFQSPQFRRLLRNGIFWALKMPTADQGPAPVAPKGDGSVQEKAKAALLHADSEATEGPLTPEAAAKAFQVRKGLSFEQVLAEPQITQPVFLNFDEKGRMWVVEYRQYPAPAGLTVLSHDNYWRAVYDQVSPPPPHQFRGLDRITIHESSKNDGVFDKHKVFLDGLNICTAVERGRGGVWVLNPPYLLFYPETGADDVVAAQPTVCLAGFGIQDTHSVANSLRWGPDGWLYGAHGSTVVSAIVRPGLDKEPIARMTGQGIWRYQPETRRFEVFSEGGGNTFGLEIDAKGRIFSGHNGGDTRGFHYMQGAYLRKGFDKHGPLSNPYAFGFFEAMPHEKVERFSHNFVIYEGGALPAEDEGRLFGCEPLQGRIVESAITPEGASFKTHDLERPVISRDRWFRPVDIKVGPDGAIYVCDWYDRQITHTHNQEGQIDRSNGRVYRLEGPETKPAPAFDLGRMDSKSLVGLLDDRNKWFRQTALRVLGDRHDVTLVRLLAAKLVAAHGQSALELLWALNLSGGLDETMALKCLGHEDPEVRLWTARLLCDREQVPRAVAEKLARVAAAETNVEARAQLACSARRLPAKEDLAIVRALLLHDEDATDARLPLLLWWAIEAKAESDPEQVVGLLREAPLWERPIVREQILERVMRRYAQAGTRKDLLVCAELLNLAPSEDGCGKLMAGFAAAFKGRPVSGLPEELLQAMARRHAGSVELALRQGDAAAIEVALKVLADEKAPLEQRLERAAIFGEIQAPASVPVLLTVLGAESNAEGLRKVALAALAAYDDPRIGERVVALYPALKGGVLSSAQMLLSSRAQWSVQFVGAVEAGRIKPEAAPRAMVRRIKLFAADDLPARAEKLWGPDGGETTAAMNAEIERLLRIVRSGTGDPVRGREIFRATCAGCHTLHGEGGHVGPDLTDYNRSDLPNLVLNIVNPSAEIREGYENFLVTTKDGRMVNGFLVEQNPKTVILRGLDGQNVTLARENVAEMKGAGVSLMPEGLLSGLDERQARDFFAYLGSAQPLVGGN